MNEQKSPHTLSDIFHHTGFIHLWIGQLFSQFAVNMMLFVLGIRIYQTTGSNAAVSGLFLAYGIPAVIFGLFAGAVVDRLDKRVILISANAIRTVLVFLLLFVSHNVPAVYAIAFLNAVVTQFYVPAEAPLIPQLVPEKLIMTANSLFTFTYYSSMGGGFILAGPLLRYASPVVVMLIISGMFAIAAANVVRVPIYEHGWHRTYHYIIHTDAWKALRRIMKDIYTGVVQVGISPKLREAIILLSGTQIVIALLGTLGPGFADKILSIDVRDASLFIMAPAVVGIILGSLWIGTYGLKYRYECLVSAGVLSAGGILLTLSLMVAFVNRGWIDIFDTPILMLPFAVVLFFLLGVANSFLDVPSNSVLQKESDGDIRGRVYGILTTAVGGIGLLPVFVGGVLADYIGIGKVLLIVGGIIMVFGITRMRRNSS